MAIEILVELHSTACACRGGTWASVGGASAALCKPEDSGIETATIPTKEWKALGKPVTLEEYKAVRGRAETGERRQFQRFQAVLAVRLSRQPDWRSSVREGEDTITEVIARGGALVRSRMAVEQNETLVFECPPSYKTRAQVGYLTPCVEGGDRFLRVGLRFLDAPFPEQLIPKDAQPL